MAGSMLPTRGAAAVVGYWLISDIEESPHFLGKVSSFFSLEGAYLFLSKPSALHAVKTAEGSLWYVLSLRRKEEPWGQRLDL